MIGKVNPDLSGKFNSDTVVHFERRMHQGVRFNFQVYLSQTDHYGYERQLKEYRAEKYDMNQQMIEEALTPKGYLRRITVNPSYEYFKAKQREWLSGPYYHEIYAQRKIDIEPAFRHLKACLGFTRFNVRGIEGVKNEMGLALIEANLRKLVTKQAKNKTTQKNLSKKRKIFWVVSFIRDLCHSLHMEHQPYLT